LFVRTGYTLVLTGSFTPTPAERRCADPDVLATFDEVKSRPELASRPRRTPDPESERVTAQNLKRLSDAGVTIAAGTDAGNIGTLHGPSIFRELRLMADAGLTTRQVLASATAGGARVMGREKDLGAVAPGKLADLLILDRDPLVDVANLEAIHRVVKGGRVDDFAVAESRPSTFYVGAASGGLWKTENNGTTFEPVFADQESSSIGDVAIAPSDPSILYVGTGEPNNRQSSSWGHGVYRTNDGGKTWTHLGLADTHHIGR